MPTLVTDPQYPVPKQKIRVTFTLSGVGANFVRVWVSDAPTGSRYRNELDKNTVSKIQVWESADTSSLTWENGDFDMGGVYVLSCQEYTRGAASYGGGYDGDPNAAPTETLVGSATTVYVYVGQRVSSPIGAGQDKATLVLWAWNDTIRATTVAIQGELSPAIIRPTSTRAASASVDANVKASLAALDGVTAATAIGSISTIVSNIITKYELHRANSGGSFHSVADSDNTISAGYKEAPTPSTLPQVLSAILSKLRQHELNDKGSAVVSPAQPGVNSGAYHGSSKVDWTNLPLYAGCGTKEDVYPVLSDLWRCYEAHRVSGIHSATDSTNTLTAAPPLMDVHRYFLAALAALSPTVPQTKSSAAVLLAAQAGFVEG